jgi:hypothetical protein
MTIRKIHSNNVTENRADIATQYTDIFFDDEANSLLLPDPKGLLELKFSNTATSTTTTTAPIMVGGAPNPFAPVVVTAPPGYKAANLDDGVELVLDTLAVQLPTSGTRSLQFRVTTGTMSVNITGQCYWSNGNYAGNYEARYWNGNTLNTTYQQIFTWSFPWANDKAVYSVMDLTNRRYYRITLIVGPGYKKNFIIMERLV